MLHRDHRRVGINRALIHRVNISIVGWMSVRSLRHAGDRIGRRPSTLLAVLFAPSAGHSVATTL